MGNRQRAANILIIALVLTCIFLVVLHFGSDRNRIAIRIHDDQIDIQKLTNAVARLIIETGYGYNVQMVESTVKEVQDLLITGAIDVTLEMWKDNNLAWYNMARTKGEVVDLGPIYTGGRQYWIIPRWYAREKNITSVFQMKKHWRDFVNPENPAKGIFFNCIFGWSCRDINRVKLGAYGLDRYYNTVSPTSPEALESIYENARLRKLPVFGYYWEPNALIASRDWFALEEPPHSPETWMTIIEAATDPNAPVPEKACAFKEINVHKLAHKLLMDKAPDVAEMLGNMQFRPGIFNEILFNGSHRRRDPGGFEAMALSFLKDHPDQWEPWVTERAAGKIRTAVGG